VAVLQFRWQISAVDHLPRCLLSDLEILFGILHEPPIADVVNIAMLAIASVAFIDAMKDAGALIGPAFEQPELCELCVVSRRDGVLPFLALVANAAFERGDVDVKLRTPVAGGDGVC